MMKPRRSSGRLLAPIAALVVLLQVGASAATNESVPAGKWAALTFDAAKTTIVYNLVGWPHVTHGTFKLKRGLIRVDPASGKMDGSIVIDAASGDSGHSMRDAKMKNDVLEVEQYPDISFAPEQVVRHGVPQGEFPVVVRGIMTLSGRQHSFAAEARVERGGDVVTIHSSFDIPFVAWGLKDPSILFFKVAKNVDLQVDAVAHLEWVSH